MIHRWIGIATCLLFAIWFVSGVVMMYVPFPSLSAAERLRGLDPIDWSAVRVGPDAVLQSAADASFPRALTLEMGDGAPVWRLVPQTGDRSAWSATDGHRVEAIGPAQAKRIAARFARTTASSDVQSIGNDQWTVAGRFDRDRPLYRVAFDDTAGTTLYVSSRSGEVVLDTRRSERFWNWLGSVPHWIYFTALRADQPLWRQVVMWVSGIGIVSAVTGMWIGILRVRLRRRYSHGRVTPYRGWGKWHHVTGLIGGLFLTTWIVSGWLSVDPFRWFTTPGISDAAEADYHRAGALPPWPRDRVADRVPGARTIGVNWVAGRALLLVGRPAQPVTVLDAATGAPAALDPARLVMAGQTLVPGHRATAERLTAEDAYYYDTATAPELPALRLSFDDPLRTRVVISPRTGAIIAEDDQTRRLYRWLYQGLHTWDVAVLTAHRPAWDIALWVASAAGLLISVSGIVIGWRRLRRPRLPA